MGQGVTMKLAAQRPGLYTLRKSLRGNGSGKMSHGMRGEMRIRFAGVWLLFALAGCATWAGDPSSQNRFAPGNGVTRDVQLQFCGSESVFAAKVDSARAALRAGALPRPKSGDSACDVLAMMGKPDGLTTVDVGGRQEMHLTYQRDEIRGAANVLAQAEHWLIVLARDGQNWIVDSVVQQR